MSEPDWAALAAVICVLVSLWLRVILDDAVWTIFVAAGVVVVLVVAARAAWLSAAVAAALWLMTRRRRWLTVKNLGAATAVLLLLLSGAFVVKPTLIQRLDPRILMGAASTADNGSANSRIGVLRVVIGEGERHLPFGAGAGSLAKVTSESHVVVKYIGGGALNAGRGSANLFSTTWFDLGPIGLGVLLALLTCLARITWRLREVDHGLSLVVYAALLTDFEFNNGIRFGFVWLFIGLLAACALLSRATGEAGSQIVSRGGLRPGPRQSREVRRVAG